MPFKTENNYCFVVRPLSLAPLSFLKEVCPDVTLEPTNLVLLTSTGETVHP